MNNIDKSKKVWVKPEVSVLIIKKDTFGGSGTGHEDEVPRRWGPPGPPGNPAPIGGK